MHEPESHQEKSLSRTPDDKIWNAHKQLGASMATTRSTLGHDKIKRTCKIHHVDSTDYFTIWKTLVFSISQFKDQFDTDKLLSHKSLLSCKNENHLRKTVFWKRPLHPLANNLSTKIWIISQTNFVRNIARCLPSVLLSPSLPPFLSCLLLLPFLSSVVSFLF